MLSLLEDEEEGCQMGISMSGGGFPNGIVAQVDVVLIAMLRKFHELRSPTNFIKKCSCRYYVGVSRYKQVLDKNNSSSLVLLSDVFRNKNNPLTTNSLAKIDNDARSVRKCLHEIKTISN